MTYQGANRVLLDDMTTTGEPMTIATLIASHTDGAADALAAQITAPRAGSRDELDPRAIEADIDRAVAATRSTLGRDSRSGAAMR